MKLCERKVGEPNELEGGGCCVIAGRLSVAILVMIATEPEDNVAICSRYKEGRTEGQARHTEQVIRDIQWLALALCYVLGLLGMYEACVYAP